MSVPIKIFALVQGEMLLDVEVARVELASESVSEDESTTHS